jgi:predicted component of type VI protein secretion system
MSLFYKFFKTELSEEERIVDHLSRLLNTYQGYGSFLPNLGLGGYACAISREKAIKALMKDIRTNIEQFDKRVSIRKIELLKESEVFNWKFRIECTFNLSNNQVLCIEMSQQKSQLKIVREPHHDANT